MSQCKKWAAFRFTVLFHSCGTLGLPEAQRSAGSKWFTCGTILFKANWPLPDQSHPQRRCKSKQDCTGDILANPFSVLLRTMLLHLRAYTVIMSFPYRQQFFFLSFKDVLRNILIWTLSTFSLLCFPNNWANKYQFDYLILANIFLSTVIGILNISPCSTGDEISYQNSQETDEQLDPGKWAHLP